jgi:hypothetical protein
LRRCDEFVDWDVGVREPSVVDLDALAYEALDRVVDVPHVDVDAGDDTVVADPEGDELAGRGIAAKDNPIPSRARPEYSMPTSYWSEKK